MARLSAQAHQVLQDLAAKRGESHQRVLEDALELLARRQFFEDAHQAYAELRRDPEHWKELEHERGRLDGVLDDGLNKE